MNLNIKKIKVPAQGRNIDYKYKYGSLTISGSIKSETGSSSGSGKSWLESYVKLDSENDFLNFLKDIKVPNLYITGQVNHWLEDVITVADASLQLNAVQDGARVESGLIVFNQDETTELSKLYYDTDNVWKIDGIKIATREDNPLSNGIAYWDSSESMFKTRSRAFDSDKLGGYDSDNYVRRDIDEVITGRYEFNSAGIYLDRTHEERGPLIIFQKNDVNKWILYAGINSDDTFSIRNGNSSDFLSILYDSGNVGINETNPTEKLHVNGNGLFEGKLRVLDNVIDVDTSGSDAQSNVIDLSFDYNDNAAHRESYIKFGRNSSAGYQWRLGAESDKTWGNDPVFFLKHLSGGEWYDYFTVDRNGVFKFISDLQNNGTFVSGFAGSGWKLDGNESHLTVDKLTVRHTFNVYELNINKVRATNGSLWVSDGVKVDYASRRSDLDNYSFNLYWDKDDGNKPCPFVVHDIIKAQHFDGRNVIEITGWVDYVGANYVRLRTSGYSNTHVDNVDKLAGLEFVRIGNKNDTDRQGSIYLTSSDDGAPFIDVLDGVIGSNISGKTRLRVGKLSGISGQSGYGIWASRDGSSTDFVISSDGYAQIAGWGFNNKSLYKTHGNLKLSLGKAYYWESNAYGLQIGQDRSNRVWIGATETDYELAMWKDGRYYFKLALNGTKIAGFSFDDTYLYTNKYGYDSGIELRGGSAPRLIVHKDYENYVTIFYNNDNDWGIAGKKNGKYAFQFGTTNQFAGVNFDNSRLWTANWELKADGTATFTKGKIGGFNFDDKYLWNGNKFGSGAGIELQGGTYKRLITHLDSNNWVNHYYYSSSDWGLRGRKNGSDIFQLGSTNQIAGITFDNEKLYTSKWSLNKNGSFSFGSGKITGDASGNVSIDNVTIDSSHIVNVRNFVLRPYVSTAISGSSSSPTSIDTSKYSCAIVSNGTGSSSGYIYLSNGAYNGQIFVVFARNDEGTVYVKPYVDDDQTVRLGGGTGAIFMYVISSMYNSSRSGRWVLLSYYDQNW